MRPKTLTVGADRPEITDGNPGRVVGEHGADRRLPDEKGAS
jgi:hypothetical protein